MQTKQNYHPSIKMKKSSRVPISFDEKKKKSLNALWYQIYFSEHSNTVKKYLHQMPFSHRKSHRLCLTCLFCRKKFKKKMIFFKHLKKIPENFFVSNQKMFEFFNFFILVLVWSFCSFCVKTHRTNKKHWSPALWNNSLKTRQKVALHSARANCVDQYVLVHPTGTWIDTEGYSDLLYITKKNFNKNTTAGLLSLAPLSFSPYSVDPSITFVRGTLTIPS